MSDLIDICPNFAFYKLQLIEVVHFMIFVFDYMFVYNCMKYNTTKSKTQVINKVTFHYIRGEKQVIRFR